MPSYVIYVIAHPWNAIRPKRPEDAASKGGFQFRLEVLADYGRDLRLSFPSRMVAVNCFEVSDIGLCY